MKLFNKATLKLTAIYTGVLLAISICFSIVIAITAAHEMNRPFNRPRIIIQDSYGDIFEQEFRKRAAQANGRITAALILVNFGVLILGATGSYFLARWTLRPIEKAFAYEARFVSDASHELRTPLAAIIMENEVILRNKKADKKELHAQVESNLEEVKKLQKLSDTLLQMSQDEGVSDPKEREQIVEQIIKILVENAVKYDPEHRQPTIERTEKEIRVIDQGIGIAPDDLPHIFDRFYRAEQSRTSDGFGLGLSLAQNLASKIDARITAENNPEKGATFSVKFQN